MDIKEKGSLLLLVVPTLVLWQNVASHPLCLQGARCQVILQDLLSNATYLTLRMHVNSLEVFLEIVKQYSKEEFIFPAATRCHTADIPRKPGQGEAKLLQHKDIINMVIRYLLSWNDPLTYLRQEAHRMTRLHDFFKLKEKAIFEIYHQLKELLKEIASQIDPENSDDVEYAMWSAIHPIEPLDETSLRFTYYNMFRCLLSDLQKIESLLEILKCPVSPDNSCNVMYIPATSEVVFKHSWCVKLA